MAYTEFAISMAEKYHIPVEEINGMTIDELGKILEKRKEAKMYERMQDETNMKRLALVFPHYQFFYDSLGEDFLKAACRKDFDDLFSTKDCWDYNKYKERYSEEDFALIFKESSGYSKGSSYRKYIVNSWDVAKVVNKAMQLHFPELAMFSPEIYSYDEEYRKCKFKIVREDETDKDGKAKCYEFECSLASFFRLDCKAMLEDYLDYQYFYKVTDLNSDSYKKINKMMNSSYMKEFFKRIEGLRQTA